MACNTCDCDGETDDSIIICDDYKPKGAQTWPAEGYTLKELHIYKTMRVKVKFKVHSYHSTWTNLFLISPGFEKIIIIFAGCVSYLKGHTAALQNK